MTSEDPVCDHEEGAAELSCQRVTKIHMHHLSPMRALHDHRDAAYIKADVGDENPNEADFERFRQMLERILFHADCENDKCGSNKQSIAYDVRPVVGIRNIIINGT